MKSDAGKMISIVIRFGTTGSFRPLPSYVDFAERQAKPPEMTFFSFRISDEQPLMPVVFRNGIGYL